MDTNGSLPSKAKVTIQGIEFEFQPRYAAGQSLTLSEGEASAFNAILAENLRNNFAPRVRRYREENGIGDDVELGSDDIAALAAAFAEYESSYIFRAQPTRKPILDPIEALASKLARESLAALLRKQGRALKDCDEEWIEEKIATGLERNPYFREEAARRIEAARSVAEITFDFS